jgi:hypothetical protein
VWGPQTKFFKSDEFPQNDHDDLNFELPVPPAQRIKITRAPPPTEKSVHDNSPGQACGKIWKKHF